MRTHATKHATNRVGKIIPKNRHILGNVLEISRFPSPISRFPSPKIQFSSPKSNFPHTKSDLPKSAFYFLQRLSAFFNSSLTFFNGFLLSPMAFWFSPTAFQFFSTAFHFPRNPRKSIYGDKYTKDHYLSFMFFATRSPSFVISATIPNTLLWCTCVPNSAPYLKSKLKYDPSRI